MIELSLPAGSLENAIYAFKGGADSVYFGLKDFSARKAAENFTISDYRKIRRYSLDEEKKIYITINTLIKDSEIESVFSLLREIERYGPDGIIVQDLGLIRIIKTYFPTIPIHASTQLAVHTDYGVKMLKELGCSRAVLSRELSLKEIDAIRKKNPDIELKVFIHGAMCYGFSGLCMASLEKTGRSANRGECAQICRTWFTDENKKRIYPFSMKDMDASGDVLKLSDAALDALKIEGRMKGNEYVYYTARYYRALLDGTSVPDKHEFTFLRERSNGYFDYEGENHKNLITEDYTGHKGKKIGTVRERRKRVLKLELSEKIAERDGLMVLVKNNDAYKFSAHLIKDDEVLLNHDIQVSSGSPVYKISDSSILLKKADTSHLKEMKRVLPAQIEISANAITIATPLLKKSYEVKTEEALKGTNDEIRRIFSQSTTESILKVERIINSDALYIRAKDAKKIRRSFLSSLESAEESEKEYKAEEEKYSFKELPERSLIADGIVPWNEQGVLIDGITYITLSPVTFDEEEKYRKLLKRIEAIGSPVMIGLNNIADLYFAKNHPEFDYFVDIYLYASNRESISLVHDILRKSLKGAYLCPDFNSCRGPWPIKPKEIGSLSIPLFISRSCYMHDSLSKSCTGCPKRGEYTIEQNGESYTVLVDKCCTIVAKKPS